MACQLCFKKTYARGHCGVALWFSFLPEPGALVVIVLGGVLCLRFRLPSCPGGTVASLPSRVPQCSHVPDAQMSIACRRWVSSQIRAWACRGFGPGSVAVFNSRGALEPQGWTGWSASCGQESQPPLFASLLFLPLCVWGGRGGRVVTLKIHFLVASSDCFWISSSCVVHRVISLYL